MTSTVRQLASIEIEAAKLCQRLAAAKQTETKNDAVRAKQATASRMKSAGGEEEKSFGTPKLQSISRST